jgi:hypothetical protein
MILNRDLNISLTNKVCRIHKICFDLLDFNKYVMASAKTFL